VNRIICLALALALLPLSCGDEEGITRPEPPPPPLNAPADVIENVEMSFNQRDVDALKKSLDPAFVFYFDPDDVGQNPPGSTYIIPESWSYTEFWSVANRMFQVAHSIALRIPSSQIGTPKPGEDKYEAKNVSISLLVMVDEYNGYIAQQGYCDFAFKTFYDKEKEKRWRLTGWWDFTSASADGAPASIAFSLGMLLAMFM
jgi:hypothetical protein